MSTELKDRLSKAVVDRKNQVKFIINNSTDPEIRIRARIILERDREIAEILKLMGR